MGKTRLALAPLIETVLTRISIHPYRKLREFLGLPDKEIGVMDVLQQIAVVDEDVRQALCVDVHNVAPRSSATHQIVVNEVEMPGNLSPDCQAAL
jgi:hypothetical protein